jgi:hypothetical protein
LTPPNGQAEGQGRNTTSMTAGQEREFLYESIPFYFFPSPTSANHFGVFSSPVLNSR